MDELQVAPRDLKSVRVAGYLQKRSGAFPYGFHSRYVVLSGNFLFLYATDADPKPKKVCCIDGATVAVSHRLSLPRFHIPRQHSLCRQC